VAVCFFGDGASNRGPVHEAMNMAAVWKLPILFVVENNQWASTTPLEDACSVKDLYRRAAGYNMPGKKVDGNDILAVRKATIAAVARARAGEGPTLIENKTYRIKGHFEGDPQKYRTGAEVEGWQDEKDPINRFSKVLLKEQVLPKKRVDQILMEVQAEIEEAVAFAEASPFPEPKDALTDLYINS